MDDLKTNLESYYLQLQQVDAALTTDPTNDELLKLRNDLQEVIDLTKELLSSQPPEPSSSAPEPGYSLDDEEEDKDPEDWSVGDKCLAPWPQDGKYYEAIIEEIQPDGKVSIGFTAYSHGDVTHISLIKPVGSDVNVSIPRKKKTAPTTSTITSTTSGTIRNSPKESLAERKAALLKQKEYLKKRKQKKLARVQTQEAEREKDKKKWSNFAAKKGLLNKKKSIFASPETVDGRVGIGTCGVSGKKMTEFTQADKWKRGWKK